MIIDFIEKENIDMQDRLSIAEIIKDGFWGKMGKYFKQVDTEKAVEVLEKAITFDKGFYFKEDGIVLGVVLLATSDTPYIDFIHLGRKALGFWNALLLHIGFGLIKPKKDDGLKLEMIAVSPKARGKGVGTKMFDHLDKIAKSEEFERLTLEVIDSNIKAKDLYTRLGFKDVKYARTALFTRSMGFDGSFTMQKIIE